MTNTQPPSPEEEALLNLMMGQGMGSTTDPMIQSLMLEFYLQNMGGVNGLDMGLSIPNMQNTWGTLPPESDYGDARGALTFLSDPALARMTGLGGYAPDAFDDTVTYTTVERPGRNELELLARNPNTASGFIAAHILGGGNAEDAVGQLQALVEDAFTNAGDDIEKLDPEVRELIRTLPLPDLGNSDIGAAPAVGAAQFDWTGLRMEGRELEQRVATDPKPGGGGAIFDANGVQVTEGTNYVLGKDAQGNEILLEVTTTPSEAANDFLSRGLPLPTDEYTPEYLMGQSWDDAALAQQEMTSANLEQARSKMEMTRSLADEWADREMTALTGAPPPQPQPQPTGTQGGGQTVTQGPGRGTGTAGGVTSDEALFGEMTPEEYQQFLASQQIERGGTGGLGTGGLQTGLAGSFSPNIMAAAQRFLAQGGDDLPGPDDYPAGNVPIPREAPPFNVRRTPEMDVLRQILGQQMSGQPDYGAAGTQMDRLIAQQNPGGPPPGVNASGGGPFNLTLQPENYVGPPPQPDYSPTAAPTYSERTYVPGQAGGGAGRPNQGGQGGQQGNPPPGYVYGPSGVPAQAMTDRMIAELLGLAREERPAGPPSTGLPRSETTETSPLKVPTRRDAEEEKRELRRGAHRPGARRAVLDYVDAVRANAAAYQNTGLGYALAQARDMREQGRRPLTDALMRQRMTAMALLGPGSLPTGYLPGVGG